jgi:hypothetical protein
MRHALASQNHYQAYSEICEKSLHNIAFYVRVVTNIKPVPNDNLEISRNMLYIKQQMLFNIVLNDGIFIQPFISASQRSVFFSGLKTLLSPVS